MSLQRVRHYLQLIVLLFPIYLFLPISASPTYFRHYARETTETQTDQSTSASSLLRDQFTNPSEVLAVLLLIGGDIIQKAIAQMCGKTITPVAFSFGWVSYAFGSLMSAFGGGVLMPDPDFPSSIVTISSGGRKQNESWLLSRLLRDLETEEEKHLGEWMDDAGKKQREGDSPLIITVYEAQSGARTVKWDLLAWTYVGTLLLQLITAAVPIIVHNNWSIMLITAAGSLLALFTGSLPEWTLEKFACREGNSKDSYVLARGNGHPHVFVIQNPWKPIDALDVEPREVQHPGIQHPHDGEPGQPNAALFAYYNALEATELERLLRERSLPTSGEKSDHAARLVAEDGALFAYYNRMEPQNLKRLLEKRSLSLSGGSSELAARLAARNAALFAYYNKLEIPELKRLFRERSILLSGEKPGLIERLVAEDSALIAHYSTLETPELKRLFREGSRLLSDGLVERLGVDEVTRLAYYNTLEAPELETQLIDRLLLMPGKKSEIVARLAERDASLFAYYKTLRKRDGDFFAFYNTLTDAELKKLLRERSLPVSGNTSDLAARMASSHGNQNLYLEDLAGNTQSAGHITRFISVIFAVLWILLLITVGAISADTWYLLGIGALGMAQNVLVAGYKRPFSAHGIPIHVVREIKELGIPDGRELGRKRHPDTERPKLRRLLYEAEDTYPGLGLSLKEMFFPTGHRLFPQEVKDWKRYEDNLKKNKLRKRLDLWTKFSNITK